LLLPYLPAIDPVLLRAPLFVVHVVFKFSKKANCGGMQAAVLSK